MFGPTIQHKAGQLCIALPCLSFSAPKQLKAKLRLTLVPSFIHSPFHLTRLALHFLFFLLYPSVTFSGLNSVQSLCSAVLSASLVCSHWLGETQDYIFFLSHDQTRKLKKSSSTSAYCVSSFKVKFWNYSSNKRENMVLIKHATFSALAATF